MAGETPLAIPPVMDENHRRWAERQELDALDRMQRWRERGGAWREMADHFDPYGHRSPAQEFAKGIAHGGKPWGW